MHFYLRPIKKKRCLRHERALCIKVISYCRPEPNLTNLAVAIHCENVNFFCDDFWDTISVFCCFLTKCTSNSICVIYQVTETNLFPVQILSLFNLLPENLKLIISKNNVYKVLFLLSVSIQHVLRLNGACIHFQLRYRSHLSMTPSGTDTIRTQITLMNKFFPSSDVELGNYICKI